jgi:hypothetical protein
MSKTASTAYLRPQDVLVACKLFSLAEGRRQWTYFHLSTELGLSVGEAHNSADRCREAGLLLPSREVSRDHLRDLLVVVVPRVYTASRGGIARGLPTSIYAPPLAGRFAVAKNALPLVWPGEDGRRGETILPIYPTVPEAARRDVVVHELLALADVLRVGDEAERERATELAGERLFGGQRDQEARRRP